MSSDRPATKIKIPRTVWVLGFLSLLMDISSEMIHALLPLFIEIREEIRGLAAGGIAALKMIICVHAGISF